MQTAVSAAAEYQKLSGIRTVKAEGAGDGGQFPSGAGDVHGDLGPGVEALGLVAERAQIFEDKLERAAVAFANVARFSEMGAHAGRVECCIRKQGGIGFP